MKGEMKMATDEDRIIQDSNACIDALTSWFQSQDLTPTDALNVMVRCSAILMAPRATDRVELETGLKTFLELFPEDVRDVFGEMAARGEK
jgi:hypothetical protein